MNNIEIGNKDSIEKTVSTKKEELLTNKVIDLLNQVGKLIGLEADDSVLKQVFSHKRERLRKLAIKMKAEGKNSNV